MHRRLIWSLLACLGIVLPQLAAARIPAPLDGELGAFIDEPRFEVRPLFAEERFPNIVVTTEGTVLAVWGQNQVRVRRSEDGGKSWGPEVPVGLGIHGGGAIVDEGTGDILIFVEDGHPPSPLTVYRSSDDGLTWTETGVAVHPDENGGMVSMHMNEHGITLRHGEHAGRLLRPSRVYAGGNDVEYRHLHYTNAVYSDDGGTTWHSSAPFPAFGTGEAALVELTDGRIYYNSRRHVSTDGLDPRRRHVAWSDDGGETWKNLSVSEVLPDGPQNLDYGLMAGLVRLPVEGADILLFSNVESPGKPAGDSGSWSERRRGTVWVSFDGGVTWPLRRLVTEGPFAYSSLIAGLPGTESEGWIYLLFEGGSEGPHQGGQVARFNLSWLLEGKKTGNGELPEGIAELHDQLRAESAGRGPSVVIHPRELTNPNIRALFEKDIYWQGYNGYHTFRIPSLIEAPDGTLLAFAEGRRNSSSDTGNIDTVLRRSFDGGKTWEPMQIVWDDGANTCGNPTALVDRTRDRVWLFMTHNLGQDTQSEITNGTSDGVRTIWSTYSDDNGATWSPPVNRFHQVQPPDTRWDATGPGNGIQLVHGPNAGRLIVPANGRNIQSDDFGLSWYQGGRVPGGTSEATVVELSDGTLMRNSRATGSLRDHLRRIVNYSDNGGASWTPVEVRSDLPCPICQGSAITHVHSEDEKPLVLFSNPGYTPDGSTAYDRRLRMTVRQSASDGDKFEHSKILFLRYAAYSSLAGRRNGDVTLLYENGNDWPYRRITFASFPVEWIADPGVLRMDFEEFDSEQTLPVEAHTLLDRTSYGLAATASGTLPVVQGSAPGTSAVEFSRRGSSIRFDDTHNRGRLNFDADNSFVIGVVFRTESHRFGGAGGSGALIAKDAGPSSPSWWLRVEDGRARIFLDDGQATVSVLTDPVVADGQWHELQVVRDAETRKVHLILDGEIAGKAADSTTGDFANTNDVVIGSFNNGSRSFSGEIEKVEIARGPMKVLKGYDAWKEMSFSEEQQRDGAFSGLLAAPAGDGVANLLKYALNLSPLLPVPPRELPRIEVDSDGVLLIYRERMDISDLAYIPEISNDLVTWIGGADRTREIFRGLRSGNMEEVGVRANFSDQADRGFVRLRVARRRLPVER